MPNDHYMLLSTLFITLIILSTNLPVVVTGMMLLGSSSCSRKLIHHVGLAQRTSLQRQWQHAVIEKQRRSRRQYSSSILLHRLFASKSSSDKEDQKQQQQQPAPMACLYQEWSLEHDKLLWDNRKKPTEELASLLGRGLGGVEARLAKLKDVNSAAYQQLFVGGDSSSYSPPSSSEESMAKTTKKLVPASEILRMIRWDVRLNTKDFSILHFDRVDREIVESPFDAPNSSISGKSTQLIDALPEHRIVGVKYKERVVWDREKRIDLVLANEGIESVINGYDGWKRDRDEAVNANRLRQREVSDRLRRILGFELFDQLKEMSSTLQSNANDQTISIKKEVEDYVQNAKELFTTVREDPSLSLEPTLIPRSDFEAYDSLSEFVALLPDATLRPAILSDLSMAMLCAQGKKNPSISTSQQRMLPEIREEDISEKFVRGSGSGGQKINKTSNRVVLVHEPTQLRIECQDTRSLHQNRKIARKRLREKLDDFLHGSQSKAGVAAQKASEKKKKARARSLARQKQRKAAADDENKV